MLWEDEHACARARKALTLSAEGRVGGRKGHAFCCSARNGTRPEPTFNTSAQERPGAGLTTNPPGLRRLIERT